MEPILELEQRLARYDPARYPVQHATTRFHLGVVLADAGRVAEAIESLASAAELFDPDALPVEHAKALNALGAAQRLAGELEQAEASFERAAELFERSSLEQEHGAAFFNLGLVRRERDPAAAAECFRRAAALLTGGPEAAAARELGATLLALGELDEAMRTLERAVELAERGDATGYGGALNALGLARLAAGAAEEAIGSFRQAAGAHPRAVRPAEFAMAKANLSLAYEQHGDAPRARLSARQALGVADPPAPVAAQAAAVLARIGEATAHDLLRVLEQEAQASWEGIVREELARSAEAPPDVRRVDAAAWIDDSSVERAEAWLGGLLELPPERIELLIRSALEALGSRETAVKEHFRADVSRAAGRFHVPQLLRLEEIFRRIAAELEEPWS
ncbi:MAG: soluble NSF attachment family protein [Gaiellaceae bacterium MAG52_C11]|nr:soluble NSF attachment family protein [Candidatus Gaiellasilicea maunaloa]